MRRKMTRSPTADSVAASAAVWSPTLGAANQNENRNDNFRTAVWGAGTRSSIREDVAKCLDLPIH